MFYGCIAFNSSCHVIAYTVLPCSPGCHCAGDNPSCHWTLITLFWPTCWFTCKVDSITQLDIINDELVDGLFIVIRNHISYIYASMWAVCLVFSMSHYFAELVWPVPNQRTFQDPSLSLIISTTQHSNLNWYVNIQGPQFMSVDNDKHRYQIHAENPRVHLLLRR